MHEGWGDESEETRLLTPVGPAMHERWDQDPDKTWLLKPIGSAEPVWSAVPAQAGASSTPHVRPQNAGPPNAGPRTRRVAVGSLAGLLSGFVVTLTLSLLVLGATDGEPGLRLSIPGRHNTDPSPEPGAPGVVVPTFAQPVGADVPTASATSPGVSAVPAPVTHTTAGRPNASAQPPGAVPIPSSQGTASVVPIPPAPASPAPAPAPTVVPSASATVEPEPEPTATPEPSESVTTPVVVP